MSESLIIENVITYAPWMLVMPVVSIISLLGIRCGKWFSGPNDDAPGLAVVFLVTTLASLGISIGVYANGWQWVARAITMWLGYDVEIPEEPCS